jgi:hypothetical protein
MDLCGELCRGDPELGRKIDCGAAAKTVATACKAVVVLMLMVR